MFEFFIALFGGLYYGGKFAKEKSDMRAYDKRHKSWQAMRDEIERQCASTFEVEQWTQEFIASGEHYEEICEWFADDFEYALGSDWKARLRIPRPGVPMSALYEPHSTPFAVPASHAMWTYHLLLAKNGLIDRWNMTMGFPVGGIGDTDMSIKFAERIERHLINAGVTGIRLALELRDIVPGKRLNPSKLSDLCGGYIKIESLCNYPTHRLWDAYTPE